MPVKYFRHIFFQRKCFIQLLRLSVPPSFLQLALLFENPVICLPLALRCTSRASSSPRIHNQIKQSFLCGRKVRNAIYSFYFSPISLSPTYHQRTDTLLVEMLTLEALFHFHWAMKISQLCPEHITSWESLYMCLHLPLSLQFLFTITSVVFIIIILSFLAVKTLNSNSLCWD